MKLDPGIHIVMHSVLSLKPGVTPARLIGARNELFEASWASSNRPKINLKLSAEHFKHSKSSSNTPGPHFIFYLKSHASK